MEVSKSDWKLFRARFGYLLLDKGSASINLKSFHYYDRMYPAQWNILLNKTEKLGIEDIEKYMAKWQAELAESRGMLAGTDMNNRPHETHYRYLLNEIYKMD